MTDSSGRWLPLVSLGLFGAALWTLDQELQRVTFHQPSRSVENVPLPANATQAGVRARCIASIT